MVAEKRASGAHPSEAYRAVARELLVTQMDTDQAEYPFASTNYLTGGLVKLSVLFNSSEMPDATPIEWQSTGSDGMMGRTTSSGLLWGLVAGPTDTDQRSFMDTSRVTISLALGSGDKKRATPVGTVDLKELWDSSLQGSVFDGTRPGLTRATLKLPMLSAFQLGTAARHSLPSTTLLVKCVLTWPPNSQTLRLTIHKVMLELEWITRPEMAALPIIDGDTMSCAMAGGCGMKQDSASGMPGRRIKQPLKQFDLAQLTKMQQMLAEQGAHIKSLAMGRAGFVPLVAHTGGGGGEHNEASKLRRLGNVSQLVSAAAIVHYVALQYRVEDSEQLQQLLDDPDTLAKMLTEADSVSLLNTLVHMYGSRAAMPSLSSLLGHTSGLPHVLTETPAIIESMLEPEEAYRRRYSDDQPEVELFSTLLSEAVVLSTVQDRAFLESPLGFAILRFALPNHDLNPVIGRFVQDVLAIQADDYLLNKPSKHDGNNRRRSPIYSAYDGLSMSTDAVLAFTQNVNWYGPSPVTPAAAAAGTSFADSGAWLSLLHLNLSRFAGQKNAAFGMGQLFVSTSKGKKLPNETAEQRQERKQSHVPALRLISSDRNVCLLMVPVLNASAVVFHRKSHSKKSSASQAANKGQTWCPSPQLLTAVVVKHAYRFLMDSEGAVSKLRTLSRYGSARLPPLSQTPEARLAADTIRELRERQQPFGDLRSVLPTAQEPWHAVMSSTHGHDFRHVTIGFESDHPDGSLVLALAHGRQVTRFELFWDQTDSAWYAVDPVTHLRGGVLDIHRLRPPSEDFMPEETLIMVGFSGHLFASYGAVEKIAAMFDPASKTGAKFMEDYRLQKERKSEASRIKRAAAWEARSRSAAGEDMSSGDEAAPFNPNSASSDSSDSSDSDGDSKKRRQRNRRQRKSSSAATKKQQHFSLLDALATGFTPKGMQRRFRGSTERHVGEWSSSFARSTALASILAFPTQKLVYPTSIYMGLMGNKHKGMVPVESTAVAQQ